MNQQQQQHRENEQADKRRYSQTCLAKPNSQARTGARKFSPVQLTINRIGNLTQLICTLLYVMTTHTCIRILYCRVYPQLPPVIGAPWGLKKNLNAFVAGTLRGYFLPVRYGSVGVQLTRLRALYQGTLTSGCVWKNLNTSYLYNAAILASFFLFACLKACFRLSLSTRNKKKRTITSKKHAYRPETSYVLYYSLKYSTLKFRYTIMLIFPNLFPKAIGIDRGFRNPIAPAIPIDMPHTKPIEIPICDSIGYRPAVVPFFLLPTPSSTHCALKVSEHDSLWQPPAAHSEERPRPQKSSRAQRCLNNLAPGNLKGTVVRGHPVVWSYDVRTNAISLFSRPRAGLATK